jgi:hypothetical protein
MANGTPDRTLAELIRGNIDLTTDTLRCALINDTVAYTFDPSTDEFVADVLDGGTTAEEFGSGSGTGYSRQSVANQSVVEDNANTEADFDADNITFQDLNNATVQGAIIYKQVGGDDTTPGDDPIIQVYDGTQSDINDLPIPTNGSDIRIEFNAAGVLSLSAV